MVLFPVPTSPIITKWSENSIESRIEKIGSFGTRSLLIVSSARLYLLPLGWPANGAYNGHWVHFQPNETFQNILAGKER